MNLTTTATKAEAYAVLDHCHAEGFSARIIKLADGWLVLFFA